MYTSVILVVVLAEFVNYNVSFILKMNNLPNVKAKNPKRVKRSFSIVNHTRKGGTRVKYSMSDCYQSYDQTIQSNHKFVLCRTVSPPVRRQVCT